MGAPYIVKEVTAGTKIATDEDLLEWMIQGEVVSTEIRRAVGLPMPGINVRPEWVLERGLAKMKSAQLIYRRVPGPTLEKLTPAEQFLLNEQISEHHGFDVLFADFDGKADNFMACAGVPYKIDAGMADIRGLRAKHFNLPANHPGLVHGANGGEHWYIKTFERRLQSDEHRGVVLQTWRLHTALTSEPAMRGVNKLKALLANPAERTKLHQEIQAAYRRIYREHPLFGEPGRLERKVTEFANETFEYLEMRFEETGKALRELNKRNGMPLSNAGNVGLPPRLRPGRGAGELSFFALEQRKAA